MTKIGFIIAAAIALSGCNPYMKYVPNRSLTSNQFARVHNNFSPNNTTIQYVCGKSTIIVGDSIILNGKQVTPKHISANMIKIDDNNVFRYQAPKNVFLNPTLNNIQCVEVK